MDRLNSEIGTLYPKAGDRKGNESKSNERKKLTERIYSGIEEVDTNLRDGNTRDKVKY